MTKAATKSTATQDGSSRSAKSENGSARNAGTKNRARRNQKQARNKMPEIPAWVTITTSVIGAGMVAGYFAYQRIRSESGSSLWDDVSDFVSGADQSAEQDFETKYGTAEPMPSPVSDTMFPDGDTGSTASSTASRYND